MRISDWSSDVCSSDLRFARVDTLIVDKTGTLTQGRPQLVAVLPEAGVDEDNLLHLAASLELGSEHPLAEAIVAGASERGVALAKAEDFESITGKGVTGKVDGKAVALGTARLVAALGPDGSQAPAVADARRDQGAQGRLAGAVSGGESWGG